MLFLLLANVNFHKTHKKIRTKPQDMGLKLSASNKKQDETPSQQLAVDSKPIHLYKHSDFITLMKYLNFEKEEMFSQAFSKYELHGSYFESLFVAILRRNSYSIQRKKDKIIRKTIEMGIELTKQDLENFLDHVVIEKINMDIERTKNYKHPTIYSKYDINGSRVLSAGRVKELEMSKDHLELFEMDRLTEEECQYFDNCCKKLQEPERELKNESEGMHQAVLNEFRKMIQNMVCKDRFLYETFYLPIRYNTSRVNPQSDAYMPVKLVITEIEERPNRKMGQLGNLFPFGIFHVSLIVGEWKFDWDVHSVVKVRRATEKVFQSKGCIAVIDLEPLTNVNSIMAAFEDISEICCEFNGSKIYDKFKCNCQHFVSLLLKVIQVGLPKNKSIVRYLKDIKKGKEGRIYHYTSELKQLIKVNNVHHEKYASLSKIKFETRIQLDQFCHWLNGLNYFDSVSGMEDYRLLKAFDRSFHMNRDDTLGMWVADEYEENGIKYVSFFAKDKISEITLDKPTYNVKNLELAQLVPERCFLNTGTGSATDGTSTISENDTLSDL
ncbi:predicted protein [Naegleria gruberi]|uniref:Predicted protein n=1 Tax=Naegleria gruberi TaxID=5762 RepID=D2VLV8_NAEGR|nr:uncharacterized protein NAEGRDRAFT_50635 [Naegleria gruberi]EFC42209.1 predicted protein [Naegleria gruberi]|eukprot:XP_002674953.1 predicted protein [Naegleria gruberi strain NEG-M]